ncbi:MAG: signal peptide peptidase SppA [Cryomorphaceae bacterium]|nr:MAG: signal peptide peptidase SppA [Cryomorphaceae bacterium]
MKQFLKFTLAAAAGLMLGVFSIIIIFSILAASGDSKEVQLDKPYVLRLELNGEIQDRVEEMPFDLSEITGQDVNILGLNDILANIKKAKTDENIKGIYIEIGMISAGFATREEIRNALLDFKESGKFITTYSEIYTQGSYYLASVADYICMYPEGGMELRGLNSTIPFFTNALKKMGIEPQVIRHGKFKSAVEPFMLTEMSDENREQIETYMGSIWEHFLKNVASDRKLTRDRLNEMAENLEIQTTEDAVRLGLVDSLFYRDQFQNHLANLMEQENYDDINFISLKKYNKVKNENARDKFKKEKVAVIYAQGEIQSGEGSETVIGSERISKAIRKARKDEKVKAIVLRVNSPGGSALASDVIWREMKLANEEKPVVVSMGDVAASGGYYIACASDKIYASPNTITGSIGVFGIMPNIEELMTDKIGITFDNVKTNKFADLGSVNRPLTQEEYDIIQKGVVDVYNTFTSKVAEGRDMSQENVDDIGQGRVWSGTNAMDINLIDEYGGLEAAVAGAAELAELEDYRIYELPEQKDPFQELLEQLEEDMQTSWIKYQLGDQYKYYKTIQDIKHLKGVQARMPYQFVID